MSFHSEDLRGAISLETTPLNVRVEVNVGGVIQYLAGHISEGIAIILLILMLIILWKYFKLQKAHKHLIKELHDLKKTVGEVLEHIQQEEGSSPSKASAHINRLRDHLGEKIVDLERIVNLKKRKR